MWERGQGDFTPRQKHFTVSIAGIGSGMSLTSLSCATRCPESTNECGYRTLMRNQSAVAELIQIVLVHAKMMPDLVEDRGPHLLDQLVFGVRRQLHVFLEDVDH